MSYVQLERGNDWGAKYLARPGKRLTSTGFADLSLGLKFSVGSSIRIRWPVDGHEETVVCAMEKRHGRWSDHGHEGNTSWEEPGFFVDSHGVRMFVSFESVLVHEGDLP